MLRRLTATLAALTLGAGAAFGVAACGEDRGSVEVEGGSGTGKTGATTGTDRTGATTGKTGATTGRGGATSTGKKPPGDDRAPTTGTAPSGSGY